MQYKIELSPLAQRQLKKLSDKQKKTVIKKLEAFAVNPFTPNNTKKLVGMDNLYRLRIGDYRIIYKIEHDILLILVLKIGHRKDIYNNLSIYLKS